MTTFTSFARRRNWDSSIDSICKKCFQTIASVAIASVACEDQLAAREQAHVCAPIGQIALWHAKTMNRTSRAASE